MVESKHLTEFAMNLFEITIQRATQGRWPVVVEQTAAGTFLPVRTEGALSLDLSEFKNQLGSQVSPLDYGTMLGQAIFRNGIRDAFVQALAKSDGQMHVLLFVEAEDLRGLRWERLCAPLDGRWDFLSLDQRVPFCLYLPCVTDRRFPPIGRLDLRALILAASPAGLERYKLAEFDAAAAAASVCAALGEIPSAVLRAGDGSVGPPTLDALCERITAQTFTLLHVVCHGRFQPGAGETILYLAGADGQVDPVTGTRLLDRLSKLRGARGLPQLAFLSTCESAVQEAGGALAGLAQRLVRELGMPAVVAMTEPVTVTTAGALAEAFYRRLREHGQVDRALSEACAGMAERHDIHVPVLYSRLGGRPLFSNASDRELTLAEIRHGLTRARDLMGQRAPVWLQERATQPRSVFDEQADRMQRTLHAEYADLLAEGQRDRDGALDGVSNLCDEVIERTFHELALGKEPPAYDGRCPFRGLYPFRPEDQEFFFGREGLVQRLQERLAEGAFLAVLGPSGGGKSSLVLAGLVPALHRLEKGLQVAYMTPGSNPVEFLEAVLQVNSRASLLVVDQFEELFTLCSDHGERCAFLERLLKLGEQMRVVLTMRADFWGECAPYRELKELMQARQELIAPMDAAELRRAMEMQAAKVGLRFEADLAATILEDVSGEPGNMPLLQHALRELWKRRHGRWLRAEEYRAVGGVKRAIAETAEAVYRDLSSPDQERVRDIFVRLTLLDETGKTEERRDTRQRVRLDELTPAGSDPAQSKALVKRLADARLLVTNVNTATGCEEVEVGHEALIRHWPRLRGWLDEDRINFCLRQGVREAALTWDNNGRDDNYLLHRGKPLERAEALIGQLRFPLNRRERAYLHACAALREREKADRVLGSRRRLEECGWGVIFARDADPSIREALGELLAHRRKQATKIRERYYREFVGQDGYHPGESKRAFLNRHGVGYGAPEPDKMPYYLLIVGDPETIPYLFQYQLDVQYAVGQIHFDTPDEYARYARSVVMAEAGGIGAPPRGVFFAPEHEGDSATNNMNSFVVAMVKALAQEAMNWTFQTVRGESATKTALSKVLGGGETPALIFTACHGMCYKMGDERQLTQQGSLLCEDWPGFGKIKPEHIFTAQDLSESANLLGTICFLWASYSAGTPRWAAHFRYPEERTQIASRASVASLPQRLLSNRNGGALAVIGLIECGWFFPLEEESSRQIKNEKTLSSPVSLFVNTIRRLIEGYPVGWAVEYFSQRAGELALELTDALEENRSGKAVDDEALDRLRIATADARTYVIVGDPAVRLTANTALSESGHVQEVSTE
jgi:hypothetical protein